MTGTKKQNIHTAKALHWNNWKINFSCWVYSERNFEQFKFSSRGFFSPCLSFSIVWKEVKWGETDKMIQHTRIQKKIGPKHMPTFPLQVFSSLHTLFLLRCTSPKVHIFVRTFTEFDWKYPTIAKLLKMLSCQYQLKACIKLQILRVSMQCSPHRFWPRSK